MRFFNRLLDPFGCAQGTRSDRIEYTGDLKTPWQLLKGNIPGDGETVHHLTREQARDWIRRTIIREMLPHEFHRDSRHRENLQPQLESLALGEVLSMDCIPGLAKRGREGMSIAAQVSGAVASWLDFAEYTEGFSGAAERVKAAPGILDCENFDCTIARRRQSFFWVAD